MMSLSPQRVQMERKINTDATGNTVWGSPARVSKRVRAHTRASGVFFSLEVAVQTVSCTAEGDEGQEGLVCHCCLLAVTLGTLTLSNIPVGASTWKTHKKPTFPTPISPLTPCFFVILTLAWLIR